MGPGTRLGSFPFFIGVRALMMMAMMMMPSYAPAVASFDRGAHGRLGHQPVHRLLPRRLVCVRRRR